MKLLKTPIAAAALMAISLGQSWAQSPAPALSFCTVSLQDACVSGVTFDAATRGVLTLLGRFSGPTAGQLTGGTVVLEHVDTGLRASIPLTPVPDPYGAAANLASSDAVQAPVSTWAKALEATIYVSALQPGDYRVVSANVSVDGTASQPVEIGLNNAARFNIVSSSGTVQGIVVKDQSGTPVANLRPKVTNNQWTLEGYPALRNGDYRIEANIGPAANQKPFKLARPVRTFDVDLPAVVGLPEVSARVTSLDPLRNRGISGAVQLVNDSTTPIRVAGQSVAAGQKFKADFASGNAILNVGADGPGGSAVVDLFNEAPDGENIRLNIARWRLEDQFGFQPNKTSAAVKVDSVVITPTRLPGALKCPSLRTFKDGDRLMESTAIQCAVEWLDRKGVDFDRYQPGVLRGELQTLGANDLSYRFGVIYTNPQTKQTAFYPSSDGAQPLQITGTTPQMPELQFSPYSVYEPSYKRMNLPQDKKLVRLTPADATSGGLLGNVSVKAPHPGLRTRVVSGSAAREYLTSFNAASYAVTSKISESLAEEEVVIESWYEKAPEFKQTLRFTAVGIPMGVSVFPGRGTVSHTESDTVLSGQIGISVGSRIEYDPQRDGSWEVVLYQVGSDGTLGAEVARSVADGTGRFMANLGKLTSSQRRLRPVATLLTNGQPTTFTAPSAQDVFLTTFDGRAPTVTAVAKTDSGAVPFTATASLQFAISGQAAVTDLAKWEISRDAGGTWEPLMDDRNRQFVGSTAIRRFTDPGEYMVRAQVANKYSGLSTTTDATPLNAFLRGNIRFDAPSTAAVNTPIVIKATPDGFGSNYEMRWQITRGAATTTDVTQNGDTFSFTPTTAESYTVRLGVKDRGAPDTAQAWLYKDIGVRAVNPLSASASIDGPTQVEAGKTYRYTARINDVVPNTASKNYTIRGAWLMPNGTRVEAESVDYTIQPGQTGVVFVTWVEGAPQNERVNTYAVRSWEYRWPSWTMDLSVDEQTVPASIRYTIRSTDVALTDLRGEPLNVTWSLPQNTTVAQQGLAGRITVNEAGRYSMIAQMSDSRGNVTNITTPEIEILPPPTVTGKMSVISPYGESKYYSPGKYTISYRIESLPRGDRFQVNELMVNGQKVGEFSGTSAVVDVNAPGPYSIAVRTLTQLGNFGQTEQTINMADAPKAVCSIARPVSSTGTTLTPTCTVEAGAVSTYEWSYLLRGEQRKLNTRSLFIRASDYGFVTNLSVKIGTTLGAFETFDVAPPVAPVVATGGN